DATIHVRSGEVLGIIGLLGSGVEDVGSLLAGRARPDAGRVVMYQGARPVPRDVTRVGFVPSDRARNAILGTLSCRENATLPAIDQFVRGGAVRSSLERAAVDESFQQLGV